MIDPGKETDIRGNRCKPVGGAYSLLTPGQMKRIYDVGERVRASREKFVPVMSFDPHKAEDDVGNPYWGSHRHVVESALKLLERKIDELLLREK